MALWRFLTEDDRVLRQYHKSARTANKKPLRGSYKINKNKIININIEKYDKTQYNIIGGWDHEYRGNFKKP